MLVQLRIGPEALTGSAVFSGILALIDVALVVESLEDLLHRLNVIVVSCADISVVADIHVIPELLELGNDAVNVFLGSNALLGSLLLDLLAVLVSACKEHYVVALHSSVPGDRIAGCCGVAVADMWVSRRIIDRRGDVKGFL